MVNVTLDLHLLYTNYDERMKVNIGQGGFGEGNLNYGMYFTWSQLQTNTDLICHKWDLYYAEALNSILPKAKAVDYKHLFIGKKRQCSSLRSRINYQFKLQS